MMEEFKQLAMPDQIIRHVGHLFKLLARRSREGAQHVSMSHEVIVGDGFWVSGILQFIKMLGLNNRRMDWRINVHRRLQEE